jgi:hypothetical protein
MASTLRGTLGLGGKGTHFLSGHGDADHDHIQDITGTIVEHVEERDLEEVFYVAKCSGTFYVGLIEDALTG